MDKDTLFIQLSKVTTTRFDNGKLHRVRTVPDVKVQTPDGPRTPEQVAWFLEHDAWEDDVISTCGIEFCASHIRLGGVESGTLDEDDKVLEMVQRTSVTLADLYRKGRARGVIAAQTGYR